MTNDHRMDRPTNGGLAAGSLWAMLLALMLAVAPADLAAAQDAEPAAEPTAEAPETPATDEAPAEEPEAAEPTADAEPGEEPAKDAEPTSEKDAGAAEDDPPAGDTTQEDDAESDPAEGEPADAAGEEAVATDEEGDDGEGDEAAAANTGWWIGPVILLSLVGAIVLGNLLGRRLGMPDHAWKLATILTTLVAAGLSVALGEFKLGPDLSGGTTLIYELEDASQLKPDDEAGGAQAQDGGTKRLVSLEEMSGAIKKRVDPLGTKEVTIRPYGRAIEVIIPRAGGDDLEYIKKEITNLGQLEFRILADPLWTKDTDIIERALKAPKSQKKIFIGGKLRARWIPFSEKEFGREGNGLLTRKSQNRFETLVLIDKWNVTGEYLDRQLTDYDFEPGGWVVQFAFNSKGANYFRRFTGDNLPAPGNQQLKRRLGIILNDELISAPNLNEEIGGRGQISGQSMTEADVKEIVEVLRAGSLPAALNKTPLSEEAISPQIGAKTAEQARYAITVSLAAVLIFMAVYYRYAGLVACLALAANLLLVVGVMVAFQAAFTLPGLAGLVLTVGMSVDANVLIFERIREELSRGAAMRMAIRNGFARATTTIVDANVTTLIVAVILYSGSTDALRGFAVTLFLGILMSMYTAIFCSRAIFDIAERRRWFRELNFFHLVGKTSLDFIGKRHVAIAASLLVIVVGLASVYSRGTNILNIDFTGGSSITMALTADEKMTYEEVDAALRETVLAEKDLLVVERGETGTRYTVNSNLASGQDAEEQAAGDDLVGATQAIIAEAFAGKLLTNQVEVGQAGAFTEGEFSGATIDLTFNTGDEFGDGDGLSHDTLKDRVVQILAAKELNTEPTLENPAYQAGSSQRFKEWTLRLGGLTEEAAVEVAKQLKTDLEGEPIFPLANRIGSKVAGDLSYKAIQAITLSLLGIVGYIWFRFQNVAFGLAAVVALVHDVLVTLGAIAVSAYVFDGAPGLASLLQIDSFQISLPIVAAFLTIIGYSLNDTIVVFDRIREVRGKSPKLTGEMINTSINQTLSRTLLTSLTTLIVVGILYFFGGPGIHGFAFALLVGVFVGTYSSIFIASPALLAMVGTAPAPPAKTIDVKSKQDAATGAA